MTVEHQVHDDRAHRAPRRPSSRRSRAIWLLVVIFVAGGLLFGLWSFNEFKKSMIAKFLSGNVPPPTPVAVVVAKKSSVERSIEAIGSLQAVRQVTVAPEVGGRVTRIHFESGAHVKAGDPLIQLNDETEQASLLALKAAARLAEANLERAVDLRRNLAGPQSTVDSTRAQYDETLANIRKTEVAIAQKLIRAPFEGDLGIRSVNLGEIVTVGASIVTLTDLSKLFVNITLPEQEEGKVSLGQEIRLAVDAFPGRLFPGTVSTVDPQVSADTRSLRIQGTIDNAERLLLPGMFANVKLMLPTENDVIVLPATAVDYSLYGDSVYVVREANGEDGKAKLTVERVSVTAGLRSGGNVVIRRGVEAGTTVVSSGQVRLSNGAAVTITDGPGLKAPDKLPTY